MLITEAACEIVFTTGVYLAGPGTPRPKGRPKPPDFMALPLCAPKKYILGSYFQAHGRKVSPSFSDVSISQTLSLRDSELHHFQNSSMMQLQHMVAWRHFSDYQWTSKKKNVMSSSKLRDFSKNCAAIAQHCENMLRGQIWYTVYIHL